MSGVHASCVERWIARHRVTAIDGEAPRCSVCHQAYAGSDQSPGVHAFARFLCCGAMRKIARSMMLVSVILAYQAAAAGEKSGLAVPLRVVCVAVFFAVAIHKALVLTVSLPPSQLPPESALLRRFHIDDPRVLSMHMSEAFATVTILLFWCLIGALPLGYFLPCLALALVPLSRVINGCTLRGLGALLLMPVVCVVVPLLFLGRVAHLACKYPERVVHPLDAGVHIVVALAVAVCGLTCESSLPVLGLLAAHSLFLVAGLVELHCVRFFQWRKGVLWAFATQSVVFAAYLLTTFGDIPGKDESGNKDRVNVSVHAASMLWLFSFAALAVSVNQEMIVRQFRIWQQRHGTFTLQRPTGSETGGAGELAQRAVPLIGQEREEDAMRSPV